MACRLLSSTGPRSRVTGFEQEPRTTSISMKMTYDKYREKSQTGTLTQGKPRVTDVVAKGLSEDEAFRRLRKASQISGRPLKVVAEALIATFEN